MDFYIDKLKQLQKQNEELYNKLLIEYFKKLYSIEELKVMDINILRGLVIKMEKEFKLYNSPIKIDVLAKAIQDSRSIVGGRALTKFYCKLCNKEDTYGTTGVPDICYECAKNMAKNIIIQNSQIFKKK